MTALIHIISLAIAVYLAASGLYQFILALASKLNAVKRPGFDTNHRRLLVLVPAYRADEVILHSTIKNMNLRYEYPRAMFDYVVISDGLKPETNRKLQALGAKVLPVQFENSTKVKSLQAAIEKYAANYDGVVILDADNVCQMNLLFKANLYLSQGFKSIQGLRKAANSDTSIALMDGFSEAANTQMLCKGANRLGLSSKLSGSAMVFDYDLFKSLITKLKAIGGFDKELELVLTKQGIYIHYAEDLVVYDEKVSYTSAFAKQRGRWLQAQYSFFTKSIGPAINSLSKGNVDYFHKVMQLALPPRVLAPFVLIIMSTVAGLLEATSLFYLSSCGLIFTLLSYLLVLPIRPLLLNGHRILRSVPFLLIGVFRALTLMKRSKKIFLHTEHKLVRS